MSECMGRAECRSAMLSSMDMPLCPAQLHGQAVAVVRHRQVQAEQQSA